MLGSELKTERELQVSRLCAPPSAMSFFMKVNALVDELLADFRAIASSRIQPLQAHGL